MPIGFAIWLETNYGLKSVKNLWFKMKLDFYRFLGILLDIYNFIHLSFEKTLIFYGIFSGSGIQASHTGGSIVKFSFIHLPYGSIAKDSGAARISVRWGGEHFRGSA